MRSLLTVRFAAEGKIISDSDGTEVRVANAQQIGPQESLLRSSPLCSLPGPLSEDVTYFQSFVHKSRNTRMAGAQLLFAFSSVQAEQPKPRVTRLPKEGIEQPGRGGPSPLVEYTEHLRVERSGA